MKLSDFDFSLPPELIAQSPLAERTASRLLVCRDSQNFDKNITDFLSYLNPNDLLVFNNTKVFPARLYGEKASGGKIEVLIERILPNETAAQVHIRASKSPKADSILLFGNYKVRAKVLGRVPENPSLFLIELDNNQKVLDVCQAHGEIPLPPYIARAADESDHARYQTVYASQTGAVAAPTAGLHFDEKLLKKIDDMGVRRAEVTLHVGAGTFQPVRVADIADHIMHAEYYEVSQSVVEAVAETRARGGRVIAIGTTSVRALESAARATGHLCAGQGETQLFITPGFQFNVIDGLLTNFHLPQSTLLMLVSALMGLEAMQNAYQHAISEQYRFFSYGDAMLCWKV